MRFLWTTTDGAWILKVRNREQAVRTVLAWRMRSGISMEDAVARFRALDGLTQIEKDDLRPIEVYDGPLDPNLW